MLSKYPYLGLKREWHFNTAALNPLRPWSYTSKHLWRMMWKWYSGGKRGFPIMSPFQSGKKSLVLWTVSFFCCSSRTFCVCFSLSCSSVGGDISGRADSSLSIPPGHTLDTSFPGASRTGVLTPAVGIGMGIGMSTTPKETLESILLALDTEK